MTRAHRAKDRAPIARIEGRWNGTCWVGPITGATVRLLGSRCAAGATSTQIAGELGIPYAAARWLTAREEVVSETQRLRALRARSNRLLAMGVLVDVATDDDAGHGDRTRAAGTILQHTPPTAGEEPELADDELAEWLVGERDSGRLAALLARGDALIAARVAAEVPALAAPDEG